MYDSVVVNGVSSNTVTGLAVLSVGLPLLQNIEYDLATVPGALISVRSSTGQVKPVEIPIEVAVIGANTEQVRTRWKAAARFFANGRLLQVPDAPGDYYVGYVKGIKLGDEKTTWLKGTVTFVANPPCACRSLGSGLIPALDTPIPEQLTNSNATCIKNFTAAGSMPSVSENGAYPPAVHLAVAGSFTRLVLGGAGGITIDYQAIADTVYVDTERMTVYRKNNGSRISLSGQTSGSFEAVAAQAGALPVSGTGLNIAVRMLVTEHG